MFCTNIDNDYMKDIYCNGHGFKSYNMEVMGSNPINCSLEIFSSLKTQLLITAFTLYMSFLMLYTVHSVLLCQFK